MTRSIIFVIILLNTAKAQIAAPVIPPAEITKTLDDWMVYGEENLFWSADYTALDTADKPMTKLQFMIALKTGKYLPLRLKTKDTTYRLYPLDEKVDTEVRFRIKSEGEIEIRNLKAVGTALPAYHFTDLDGISKDVVFIALAFDSTEVLKKFLLKNPFRYAIVPDQEDYEEHQWKSQGYPTHIVVNKSGLIEKVIVGASPDELKDVLKKL